MGEKMIVIHVSSNKAEITTKFNPVLRLDPEREDEMALMHIYSSPFLKFLEKTLFKYRNIEEKERLKLKFQKEEMIFLKLLISLKMKSANMRILMKMGTFPLCSMQS